MMPILGAVFVASVLGSGHCAGMCGAFALIAVSDGCERPRGASRVALAASYNAGRMLTYVLLGTMAGVVGHGLNLGGGLVGVQRVALALSAGLMLGIAALRIARELGVLVPAMRIPQGMLAFSRRAHERAFALPPALRALAVGMLTTLLPCGWLYTFVVAAAGTASPLAGASVMAAFWLGTLPMMAGVAIGARALLGRLGPRSGLVAAVLMAIAAMWTLSQRTQFVVPPALASLREASATPVYGTTPACHPPQARTLPATKPTTPGGAP
jgi:hypothetical protein